LIDYHAGKKMEQQVKKKKSKKALQKRLDSISKIGKKPEEKWRMADLNKLLTYKKNKNDPILKNGNNDRLQLMKLWHDRKNCPSPCCSPCSSDDELDDGAD
jgi:hypothetical protein